MFGKGLGAVTGAASAAAGAASAAAGKGDKKEEAPAAEAQSGADAGALRASADAGNEDIEEGVLKAAEDSPEKPHREEIPGCVPSGNSTPDPKATQEKACMFGAGMGFAAKAAQQASSAAAPMAQNAAGSAMSAAKAAGDVAAPMAADAAKQAAAAGMEGAKIAKEEAEKAAIYAKEEAEKAAKAAKEWAKEMFEKFKKMIEIWVKRKIHEMAGKALDRVPPTAKGFLEDDEMPRCVSRGKDRLVDSMWPHIREEVMYEIAVMLDGKADEVQHPDAEKGVDCFRAFVRYHMFPYDKGFWGKLRDPVHILFNLISCIPFVGISPLFFCFIFFIIDKSDEFQCVQFILRFKGFQFVAQGIIKSLIGFYGYVGCVTMSASNSSHSCSEEGKGPGVMGTAGIIGMFGYISTVILIWVSFLLLRCSKEKGRTELTGLIQENSGQEVVKRKGGVLIYFLYWDLFAFLLCCAACVYVATLRPNFKLDDWAFATTVFAAQIVYGLMSFPFFFFTLPGLQRAMAHTLPTAYDEKGRCRAPKKPDLKPPAPKKDDPPADTNFVSEDDSAELWGRLRAKAGIPSF